MSKVDNEFNKLCAYVLNNGKEYHNKNRGVKRLQVPSYNFRHEMSDGFPALSTKRLYFKGVTGELIWFLRGDNHTKYLKDNGIHIWDKDALNFYNKENVTDLNLKEFQENVGSYSVGQNYSVQWRDYNGNTDQIKYIIDEMKRDIMSSRIKLNAWNPSELNKTALPPCHDAFQIVGVPLSIEQRVNTVEYDDDVFGLWNEILNIKYSVFGFFKRKKLSELSEKLETALDKINAVKFGFELHWSQRSADIFLGIPFNIASYATLGCILEEITGFKFLAIEGNLKCVHFYDNQYEAVKELMSRSDDNPNCTIQVPKINGIDDFDGLNLNDFKLVGYKSHKPLKVEMLAPNGV